MSKQGMVRPDRTHTTPKRDAATIPLMTRSLDAQEEILMNGNPEAGYPSKEEARGVERPIAGVYPVIDNDLARDNVENDIPAADLEDCGSRPYLRRHYQGHNGQNHGAARPDL